MAFSENQVRQLYVATIDGSVNSAAQLGTIKAKADKAKETLWFEYKGAGGITATDKIKVANIVSAKSIKGEHIAVPLNRKKITINDAVVAGQDYLLRVLFRNYVGMSDEDTYLKYGMVHGVKSMTADTFYKTLAVSLAKNLSRDEMNLIKIYAHSATGAAGKFNSTTHLTEVTAQHSVSGGMDGRTNDWDDGSKTVTDIDYILLEEVEQPWVRGKIQASKIPFEVYCDSIKVDYDDVIWGTVAEDKSKVSIKSGKLLADLEYFCMGKRGDIYRGMGYPNNIETQYQVDPDKDYDILDITYFYAGDNEDVQKSQKTITIVSDNHTTSQIMKAILADIKSVAGITIADLA